MESSSFESSSGSSQNVWFHVGGARVRTLSCSSVLLMRDARTAASVCAEVANPSNTGGGMTAEGSFCNVNLSSRILVN